MTPLILASTSIYRKELLLKLGVPFTAEKPPFDEDQGKHGFPGTPADLCVYLGQMKAKSLANTNNCVIGSDQMAILGDEILGKPKTFESAAAQLLKMQGRSHQLLTSVSVYFQNQEKSFLNVTTLQMKKLSSKQIENYLRLDEPFDCAGSYKIEKHGIALMEQIETEDFTAIQGLPLLKLSQILTTFGYQVPGKGL